MASRRSTKRRRTLRPRTPSRVKKRTKPARSHHHPELWGLGMTAVGLFLVAVLWLGWDGGPVGSRVTAWLEDGLGVAAYVVPAVLVGVGGLLLVRSALVDVKPFRTGVVVGVVGLMIALGKDHGGGVGSLLGGGLAKVVGETGAVIVGVTLLLAGALLVSGASAGALLRRSGGAVRRAGVAARRRIDVREPDRAADEPRPARAPRPVVDGVEAFPDVIAPAVLSAEPPSLVAREEDEPTEEDATLPFEPAPTGEYTLPDRGVL
jgi:S-DNA-T family DNA segregation ATPase FtsK/SpoIIIE